MESIYTRTLTINNPQEKTDFVIYSWKEHGFIAAEYKEPDPTVLYHEGVLFHKDSPEAKRQTEMEELEACKNIASYKYQFINVGIT